MQPNTPYIPPSRVVLTTLEKLLSGRRYIPKDQRNRLGFDELDPEGLRLWCAGDLTLVQHPCVAVVGTRNVSTEGAKRANKLGRELAEAGVIVVSGLAKGVDTHALTSAIEHGGRVIGVIGTPIDEAYPAENRRLQEYICAKHLLISQFEPGLRVFKSNFPARNKLMAAVTDATVIVEASNTSGTKHQAAETQRLGRWLFFPKSMIESNLITWPLDFMKSPGNRTMVFDNTAQIIIRVDEEIP